MPGIGERTAPAPVLRMPELGTLKPEQAAALAVLDHSFGSGRSADADRRSRLRRALYAAALPTAVKKGHQMLDPSTSDRKYETKNSVFS